MNEKHLGSDVGEHIRRRMAADPELASRVKRPLERLAIARQVKSLRKQRSLSQADLAERVGTRQPAIARIESARALPKLDLLARIADAMGMDLSVRFKEAAKKTPRKHSPLKIVRV